MSFHTSIRRKLAIATWSSPKEGNIYGKMSIDVTNSLDYIQYLRQKFNEKITITHLVGKAAALAFAKCPDLNGRIFLGKYIPHKTVDMSFLVSLNEGSELAKFKVCELDKKPILDIAKELNEGCAKLRKGKDLSYEKPKKMIKLMPTWMLKFVLWLTGYLTSAAGFNIKCLNLEKFPFGACIITNVGMFGMDEGYAPPTPFARVPVYLAIPEVKKKAVVIDDQITIRPILNLTATIDHRFLDGHRGAMIAKMIKTYLETPWTMDGLNHNPC